MNFSLLCGTSDITELSKWYSREKVWKRVHYVTLYYTLAEWNTLRMLRCRLYRPWTAQSPGDGCDQTRQCMRENWYVISIQPITATPAPVGVVRNMVSITITSANELQGKVHPSALKSRKLVYFVTRLTLSLSQVYDWMHLLYPREHFLFPYLFSLFIFSLVSAFSQKNKTYKMGLVVCVSV